jgi:hypothetical protein
MKARLPAATNTRMVLEIENFSTLVPKIRMVPAVEAIPNRVDKIQTTVLRAVMI